LHFVLKSNYLNPKRLNTQHQVMRNCLTGNKSYGRTVGSGIPRTTTCRLTYKQHAPENLAVAILIVNGLSRGKLQQTPPNEAGVRVYLGYQIFMIFKKGCCINFSMILKPPEIRNGVKRQWSPNTNCGNQRDSSYLTIYSPRSYFN